MLMSAGIVRRETETSRLSANAYVSESTRFIKRELTDLEADFLQVKGKLSTLTQPRGAPQAQEKVKTSRYGDPHPDDAAPPSESQKEAAEVAHKKDEYRKMVRNRWRQKKL